MRDIHIINAAVRTLVSTTQAIWQWAYGLELHITGIDLPEVFEAHLCNDGDAETKTAIGQGGVVKIYDEYLETGKDIFCYLFLHDAETDGRTVRKIVIPIKKREKPSDLEPTPVQQDAITQAIGAMQAARADIESIAEDAHQAIEDAFEEAKESGEFKGDKGDPGDVSLEQYYGVFPTDTASGSIASFHDGADDIPMKSVKVAIEPVQSGSGDPSPDNIRPISGWTGAQVVRAGVNVWDEEWEQGKISEYGNNVADSSRIRAKNLFSVKPGGTYYIVGARISWVEYDKERNFIRLGNNGSFVGANESFTVSNDAYYIRFFTTVSYGGTYNHDISINYPATDTDYHPYIGNTYSITFPSEAGTVYGGELDVTNGVLTVDRGIIASYNGETLPSEWISDRDKYVAGATPTTGAQVCYKLSQAVVYTLTPTEIKSLLGKNNVWADAGDTSVTYHADTKLYIDKKIAEVINALS